MLYDQAMLILAYSEAYLIAEDPFYKKVVYEIVDYIDDKLKSPEGVYYSAEDADTEGEEGYFYTWTTLELKKELGKDYDTFKEVYSCQDEGNFLDESTAQPIGRNCLFLSDMPHHWPRENAWMQTLKKARETRAIPHLDDKVLTDWNGLLLGALAKAGSIFNDDDLLNKADAIYTFYRPYIQTNATPFS